jgi:hypothetical protein
MSIPFARGMPLRQVDSEETWQVTRLLGELKAFEWLVLAG